MTNEKVTTGTPNQEAFFDSLWQCYWENQAAPGGAGAARRSRRFRQGLALFASNRAIYELAIQKAQIEIWKK